MADVKVLTDLVMTTANEIGQINSNIKNDFTDVRNAINRLNAEWDGQAATEAMGQFNNIASQFCDSRYKVMENYVSYLKKQVTPGYENTENANVKLADAFK